MPNPTTRQHGGSRTGAAPRLQIAVCGGANCSSFEYELAFSVGQGLALQGVTVICGGRGGVMQAVAEGARSVGGLTVGILPSTLRNEANPFIEVTIATGMGQARNLAVVLSADAVIAIGGEFGTLSEIALALKHGVPVIALHSWRLDAISRKPLAGFVTASTAEEAVSEAIALARPGPRGSNARD